MVKSKDPVSMSELFQQYQAVEARADETRQKRDRQLAIFRERLMAGETTGDPCRDFVLLHFGTDDALLEALWDLQKRLRTHAEQLVLFVQYEKRGQAQKHQHTDAIWRLGILHINGAGLVFPKSETGLPMLRIAAETVRSKESLLFGDQAMLLDALRSRSLEAPRKRDDLAGTCHLYVGNAAVVKWFGTESVIPYSLWSQGNWLTLATVLRDMGRTADTLPEVYAWLQEKKNDLLEKLAATTEHWLVCLRRISLIDLRDDESPKTLADELESPHFNPKPGAYELIKQFREQHALLGRLVQIGDELRLKGDPVFDKAKSLCELTTQV